MVSVVASIVGTLYNPRNSSFTSKSWKPIASQLQIAPCWRYLLSRTMELRWRNNHLQTPFNLSEKGQWRSYGRSALPIDLPKPHPTAINDHQALLASAAHGGRKHLALAPDTYVREYDPPRHNNGWYTLQSYQSWKNFHRVALCQ